MPAGTARRSFPALVRTDLAEMIRDPQLGVSMLTMALITLVLHSCFWLAFAVKGDEPRVYLAEGVPAAVFETFEGKGAVNADEQPNLRIELAESDGTALNLVLLDSQAAWDGTWQQLRGAQVPVQDITVVAEDGELVPEFLRMNLGTSLLALVASAAFIGTTVPIVAARERGMLRLLGTTPLPRSLFLMAKVPGRLAFTLLGTAGIVWIGLARNYMEFSSVPRLLVTLLCGIVFLFGPAMLFAARARNASAMQQVMVMAALGLVYLSGAIFPSAVMAEPYRTIMGFLPGSWLTESASADLAGADPLLPVPVYWALMLVTGITCFVFAARRFSWGGERIGS